MHSHDHSIIKADIAVNLALLARVFYIFPNVAQFFNDLNFALVCYVGAYYPLTAFWHDFKLNSKKSRIILLQVCDSRFFFAVA